MHYTFTHIRISISTGKLGIACQKLIHFIRKHSFLKALHEEELLALSCRFRIWQQGVYGTTPTDRIELIEIVYSLTYILGEIERAWKGKEQD